MQLGNSTAHLTIPKLKKEEVPVVSKAKKFKVEIDATIEADDIGHALLKLADYYYEIAYDSTDIDSIYLTGKAEIKPI